MKTRENKGTVHSKPSPCLRVGSLYTFFDPLHVAEPLVSVLTHEQQRTDFSLGYRKMQWLLLNEYGLRVGKNRLLRIMREHHLLSQVRRTKPGYRNAAKAAHIAPNRLNRNFQAEAPLQKLAIDMTYIPIVNGMVYMAAVLDLYNNEVLLYKLSQKPDAAFVTETVQDLQRRYDLSGSILHSDQGVQFTNGAYCDLLQQSGIVQSMSRRGNCWDNAVIESFFGHFKCECIKLRRRGLKCFADVQHAVDEYIAFYNQRRPQLKLGGLAPLNYRLSFQKT